MSTEYEINYEDKRFQDVEADKKQAISELEKTYSGMINDSDSYYQAQIDASKEWEKKQSQLQQEQTDFAIQKIEQEKDQAKKDYTKEQSGAYVDWKKQSDQHGVRAEQLADQGMQGTGYSESSQVSMYNTYQNRVTAARESYNQAVLNYNNSITEARLQNNSALAEIAYNALQQQLELSLQGFQYKNQLLLEQADKKTAMENEYYARYQDVLAQINTENALAEQIRQFNASLAEDQRQFDTLHGGSSGGGGGGVSGGTRPSSGNDDDNDNRILKDDGPTGSTKELNKETKQSILDLGEGPISAKNLASQVASGRVIETTSSSGKTVFKRGFGGLGGKF